MKELWKRTKETIALGVAQANELISDKKIETDTEYLDRETKINDIELFIGKFQEHLTELNSHIKRTGVVFSEICADFRDSMSVARPDLVEVSRKANEVGAYVNQCATKVNEYYFPTHVIEPLKKAIVDYNNLKKTNDDCKKMHILLNQSEESLKKAQASNSADVAELQQEVEDRKTSYNKLHSEFISGANEFLSNRGQLCNDVFTAAICYIDELMKITREQISKNIADYSFESNSSKLPSLENPVPEKEAATK